MIIYENAEYNDYKKYLKAICSLSKLFSDSNVPYLHYRIAESIFCRVFNAENLSRADVAFDAKINNNGVGLKTFIDKGSNNEKIAEFNSSRKIISNLRGKELALQLSQLRNERISFAKRTYNIDNSYYHCVTRKENELEIFEVDYDLIDLHNISKVKETVAGISFEDGINIYSFNHSKSTLFRKFIKPVNTFKISIDILEDPLLLIENLFRTELLRIRQSAIVALQYVILPLYSTRSTQNAEKVVQEKSALNQWNAGGRVRDFGEVYIPVPKAIHNNYPGFFPSRDDVFNLHLPHGEILQAKLCQDNSKALMTNPNNALSDWLLRKVLKLDEGELLRYNKLRTVGVDSVRITKRDSENYLIDFTQIDSYERFINNEIEE